LATVDSISFFVPGVPKPGGSKTAFYNKKLGRAMIVDACKGNKDWKTAVKFAAAEAMQGEELFAGPVEVRMQFFMPRIKAHYTPKGALRPAAPLYHTGKPDVLKLARSTEDAMTGVVWRDDSSNVAVRFEKYYDEKPGAHITVKAVV
jgi:Holliday junction resolvase RusA-like endonuclease